MSSLVKPDFVSIVVDSLFSVRCIHDHDGSLLRAFPNLQAKSQGQEAETLWFVDDNEADG